MIDGHYTVVPAGPGFYVHELYRDDSGDLRSNVMPVVAWSIESEGRFENTMAYPIHPGETDLDYYVIQCPDGRGMWACGSQWDDLSDAIAEMAKLVT